MLNAITGKDNKFQFQSQVTWEIFGSPSSREKGVFSTLKSSIRKTKKAGTQSQRTGFTSTNQKGMILMLNDNTSNKNLQLPQWARPAIDLFNEGKISPFTLFTIYRNAVVYQQAMANLDASNKSTIHAAQLAVIGKQISIRTIRRASV